MTPAFADEVHTDFVTNAEYIKGHLEQAISNKQAGNLTLTIAHAGHPIHEVFTLMEGPLAKDSPQRAADLKAALEALPNAANSDSLQAFTDKVTEINGMLDEAVTVFAGDEATELESLAIVVSNLLETAEHEYSEGVAEGEIVEMIEYQDSTAFIERAKLIFLSIKAQLPTHEAEEIEDFFGQLDSLTKSKSGFDEVETVIGGIVHEFEEAVGLEGEEDKLDGWGYIDRINELLDQVVTEYKAGNVQQAKALAVDAYLNNYEKIEDDIKADNATLMLKIEEDMRIELDDMIDRQAPSSEIDSHVQAIKADLELARAVVVPEFPVALLLVAATMAIVVVLGKTGRLRLGPTL
jgi:hypothetical protein